MHKGRWNMVTRGFQIGHTQIELLMPEDMPYPSNLEKFRMEEQKDERIIRYVFEYTDDIDKVERELLVYKKSDVIWRENLRVFYTETGEVRLINFFGAVRPYAITKEEGERNYRIWIERKVEHILDCDTVFLAALCLEKQIIRENALLLHSAYICWKNMAILFSAPSETGKSTQASLWEKYRGASTVNGDRSLLIREKDGWTANGWPVCGTSEICENRSYPIRGIVMLKQAKENKVYSLKGIQAFRELMEQITINSWNSEFQIKVMDNLELLLREVPIYKLECDISEDAVACLEQCLQKNED